MYLQQLLDNLPELTGSYHDIRSTFFISVPWIPSRQIEAHAFMGSVYSPRPQWLEYGAHDEV